VDDSGQRNVCRADRLDARRRLPDGLQAACHIHSHEERFAFAQRETSSVSAISLHAGDHCRQEPSRPSYATRPGALANERAPRAIQPGTRAVYLSVAKKQGFTPDIVELNNGGAALFFGSKKPEKTLVWFHGGSATTRSEQ
jgi:hypothetical protein